MVLTQATKIRWIGFSALLIAFLTLWLCQTSISGWCNDESAHIPAGLYHLETGRMDAYRVNPPLPRMLAALPLVIDRPKVEWHYSESPYVRSEYQFANEWVPDNFKALPRYLFLARSTVLVFFTIGLWAISRWAWRLYGKVAGWTAATLWSMNPDIITNSAVVAPDLPAAASGLLAGYVYWDWLGRRERPFPWTVAAAVAFAILCKFSWLFLVPLLPCVTLLYDLLPDRKSPALAAADDPSQPVSPRRFDRVRDSLRLLLSFSLTVLLINWCYGYDGTGTQLGDFQFISQSFAGQNVPSGSTGNRFANGVLAVVPVPLPAEMIRGIDYLKWEFQTGMQCYLRGEWKHRGWWHFHLYAIAVKMPLGYLFLIGAGFLSLVWDRCRNKPLEKIEWLPIMLAAIFIALVSSQTGFTHHVRYVLPAYGFLFIVASRCVSRLPQRWAIVLVFVCLSGTMWFHATHLGLSHTFFNPLAGGPNNGWRHLSFSNVDWGQSTYRMVDWVKEHPEQRPMTVQFVSSLGNPAQLVAEEEEVFTSTGWRQANGESVATPTRSGWYLISSYQMTFSQNRYFWGKQPVAQPYPDVLLFHVSPEDSGE